MHSFQDLDLKTLKKICSKYNLHIKIAKYSKLSKEQLIPHMEKHLHINSEGKIKMKKEASEMAESELNKLIHELKNKVKEVKEKVIKIHAKKAENKKEHKPEEKKVEKKEEHKPKKEIQIDEKEEKKEEKKYNKYADYNEDEKKFMNNLRDKNYLDRPEKIKAIYHMTYEDKFIGKFYIYRMQQAREGSLEQLKKSIYDTKNEHHLQYEIDELNKKIKNSINAFKTKKAQENANKRIEEWRNEKHPKERQIEKYNKIRDIQKENYKKLKDMKIETVKDADEYADLINASQFLNLNYKYDAELKKKDEEHQEFINNLGKKIDEEKPEEEEENQDILFNKLTQKIFITPIEKIKKALIKLNYKGKMETNKMLLNLQLSKEFNTNEKIKKLLNELEEKPEEKNPMDKIEKIQNELNKLEQIIKIDEKQNEKEHKQLKKEIKHDESESDEEYIPMKPKTASNVLTMKVSDLKELAKKHNISLKHKVNNKEVAKGGPMLKKEIIKYLKL